MIRNLQRLFGKLLPKRPQTTYTPVIHLPPEAEPLPDASITLSQFSRLNDGMDYTSFKVDQTDAQLLLSNDLPEDSSWKMATRLVFQSVRKINSQVKNVHFSIELDNSALCPSITNNVAGGVYILLRDRKNNVYTISKIEEMRNYYAPGGGYPSGWRTLEVSLAPPTPDYVDLEIYVFGETSGSGDVVFRTPKLRYDR